MRNGKVVENVSRNGLDHELETLPSVFHIGVKLDQCRDEKSRLNDLIRNIVQRGGAVRAEAERWDGGSLQLFRPELFLKDK